MQSKYSTFNKNAQYLHKITEINAFGGKNTHSVRSISVKFEKPFCYKRYKCC